MAKGRGSWRGALVVTAVISFALGAAIGAAVGIFGQRQHDVAAFRAHPVRWVSSD